MSNVHLCFTLQPVVSKLGKPKAMLGDDLHADLTPLSKIAEQP